MDFCINAWGTLQSKWNIYPQVNGTFYPHDFFLLGTESGKALTYDNT